MRVLLLALMIVLLPLRGWMGDAMAWGQMSVPATSAPAPCHGGDETTLAMDDSRNLMHHSPTATAHAGDTSTPSHTGGQHHIECDGCVAALPHPQRALPLVQALPPAPITHRAAAFNSAWSLPALRPPDQA